MDKITRKIYWYVSHGFRAAAFRSKSNASLFARLWMSKGYAGEYRRSSGPVAEGGYEQDAYYVSMYKLRSVKKVRAKKNSVLDRMARVF